MPKNIANIIAMAIYNTFTYCKLLIQHTSIKHSNKTNTMKFVSCIERSYAVHTVFNKILFVMYIYVDKIYFNFITTVWGPLLTWQPLQRLERMQNQAVRLCKHLTKFDHILEH